MSPSYSQQRHSARWRLSLLRKLLSTSGNPLSCCSCNVHSRDMTLTCTSFLTQSAGSSSFPFRVSDVSTLDSVRNRHQMSRKLTYPLHYQFMSNVNCGDMLVMHDFNVYDIFRREIPHQPGSIATSYFLHQLSDHLHWFSLWSSSVLRTEVWQSIYSCVVYDRQTWL